MDWGVHQPRPLLSTHLYILSHFPALTPTQPPRSLTRLAKDNTHFYTYGTWDRCVHVLID